MADRGAALVMDLGGTGARALVIDGDRRVQATGPAANPNRVGRDAARECLVGLLCDLRLEGIEVPKALLGMAGLSHPASRTIVREAMAEVGVTAVHRWLVNDAELAHLAAFRSDSGLGILVVAGTGSIAVGRTRTGEFVRAGGLGPVLGDEGSGHWIGARLLELAQHDASVRRALGSRGWPEDRLRGAVAKPSVLAELVDGLAEGLPIVEAVGQAAGHHLAALADAIYRQTDAVTESVRVSGSVITQSRVVRSAFTHALRQHVPPLLDHGDVGDVLEEGMAWLQQVGTEPVPPGW